MLAGCSCFACTFLVSSCLVLSHVVLLCVCVCFVLAPLFLFPADAVSGANFRTGTAAGACIGIDPPGIVLFADSVDGAFGITSAAVDAFVLIDDVSHVTPPDWYPLTR